MNELILHADTEAELKQQGTNWFGMTRAAQNRVQWRGVVDGYFMY